MTQRATSWSDADRDYLRKNYGSVRVGELSARLGRTTEAIRRQASLLGVSRRRAPSWTKTDERYLRQNYLRVPAERIAAKLGRGLRAVYTRARAVGVTGKLNRFESAAAAARRLEVGENVIMAAARAAGIVISNQQGRLRRRGYTAFRFPPRVFDAALKAYRDNLRWRPWTPVDEGIVKRFWGKRPVNHIARALKRSVVAIREKAGRLGLRQPPNLWTAADDAYLRAHYNRTPFNEILAHLGRRRWAVRTRAYDLGLTRANAGLESIATAAERIGVAEHHLRAAMTAAGHPPTSSQGKVRGYYKRFTAAEVDTAWDAYARQLQEATAT